MQQYGGGLVEILVLGGEGGSVKLLGKRIEQNCWVLMKKTIETAMKEFGLILNKYKKN
ncbi:hypothetical protein J2S74_001501 [Evansella vedderi]|uniref:CinA C-terminal domain-containing protein n=1 Tax=Evansella vedderi TaxID=38282 RepID=A0ABT9ZSC6_9BACI|nr:hypothetical protein [Evansella vedderi]MDQ0254128.1 hypothetical protein [Evansella vedderi]